jgi:hypothetical protein
MTDLDRMEGSFFGVTLTQRDMGWLLPWIPFLGIYS